MTAVQVIETLLETEWTESIDGRPNDVPKPQFSRTKEDMQKRLNTQDVIRIVASGDARSRSAFAFNWTHDRVDESVTLELRSADRIDQGVSVDGEIRMWGGRGAGSLGPLEKGRWPGLVGEVERILRAHRKGVAEWHIIAEQLEVQDQSDLGGAKYYRADVLVPLVSVDELETDPSP